MDFQPNYQHIVDAALNRKPQRLCLYEHLVNAESIAQILDVDMPPADINDPASLAEHFRLHCDFYRRMTYDTVTYEVCVTEMLPGGGALLGERDGPIQSREDFEAYPWDELPEIFWTHAEPRYQALAAAMPDGMKAIGGIGNGPFEISEDLVGFEKLCYMQLDDPELFTDLYNRIGDLLMTLWGEFLRRHGELYCVCRIGDDMGYKTQTLLSPPTLLEHIIPQYRRVVGLIRGAGKPFLLHSCGKIFPVMDALIDAGISAKHSNEDVIAPFQEWIDRYGDRIGLFGGIDTDRLGRMAPEEIYEFTKDQARQLRSHDGGWALGSGNSIPAYVPVEGYQAMIRAAKDIRAEEAKVSA